MRLLSAKGLGRRKKKIGGTDAGKEKSSSEKDLSRKTSLFKEEARTAEKGEASEKGGHEEENRKKPKKRYRHLQGAALGEGHCWYLRIGRAEGGARKMPSRRKTGKGGIDKKIWTEKRGVLMWEKNQARKALTCGTSRLSGEKKKKLRSVEKSLMYPYPETPRKKKRVFRGKRGAFTSRKEVDSWKRIDDI